MSPDTSIITVAKNNLANLPRLSSINAVNPKAIEIADDSEEFVDFPQLPEKALSGNAGAIVNAILPYTEADAAGLLIHLLAGFGCAIGRTAHFRVGQSAHYLKLFAVIVGRTGQRKGTAWNEIQPLLTRADYSFESRILGGLSSGEGLIYSVRDDILKRNKLGSVAVAEEGVEDKRLFAIEEEFGGLLQRAKREGNTLSATIRQAWDSGTLRVMTKQPVTATDSHISIIGHITPDELRKTLTDTDTANGFANRFLWICTRRSKFLPDGDCIPDNQLNPYIQFMNDAIDFAVGSGKKNFPGIREMRKDAVASDYWHTIYEPLNNLSTGLLGMVTSRAPVQVLRLACLYALLEAEQNVGFDHLDAAYHLWQYAYDSAKYIFGVATGDKNADKIFDALSGNEDGMTRTQLNNLFSGHITKGDLTRGLQSLIESSRIELVRVPTAGRPRELFKVKN